MRNKLLVMLSVIIFGISPVFAYAQDSVATNTVTSTDTTVTTTPAVTSAETRTGIMKPKPTIREALKDAKSELRAKMLEARTNFKTKITEIKDQRKQTIVTNLDSRISTINKNRTDEMYKRIDRLTSVLTRISSKEAALKSEGKNTTTLVSDIAAAQAAIDLAKQAVVDQAAKDYVMTLTTDASLKVNASTLIKQFLADIKAVYLKVVAAQTAVFKAYTDVAKLMGVSPTPTAATTPTVTTTP